VASFVSSASTVSARPSCVPLGQHLATPGSVRITGNNAHEAARRHGADLGIAPSRTARGSVAETEDLWLAACQQERRDAREQHTGQQDATTGVRYQIDVVATRLLRLQSTFADLPAEHDCSWSAPDLHRTAGRRSRIPVRPNTSGAAFRALSWPMRIYNRDLITAALLLRRPCCSLDHGTGSA
jgi:hypothetical protein